jgi:hypothetical protein
MSREACRKAAKTGMLPYVPLHEDEIDAFPPFPFPFLGDYRPTGWKLVEELFCDSSGFGASDEPALSVEQLKRKLTELQRTEGKAYGYGIIEAGQFQLYLGVFERRKYRSLGEQGRDQSDRYCDADRVGSSGVTHRSRKRRISTESRQR